MVVDGSWTNPDCGSPSDGEDVVQNSRFARVVEVLEQQQAGRGRQNHRQVDQDPQVALGVPELVEHDRDEERQRVAQHAARSG